MERAAVLNLLRVKAVELLDLEADQIQEGVSFKTDLDVDSLALVEYTMALEDELDISLPEEEVADLQSVGSFVDLIVSKTEAAA
jgi:acyl carrier protein